MINVIIILVICVLVILAISFIIKSKKRGQACIGCPMSQSCNRRNCDRM